MVDTAPLFDLGIFVDKFGKTNIKMREPTSRELTNADDSDSNSGG
jgi:hypothetical protein